MTNNLLLKIKFFLFTYLRIRKREKEEFFTSLAKVNWQRNVGRKNWLLLDMWTRWKTKKKAMNKRWLVTTDWLRQPRSAVSRGHVSPRNNHRQIHMRLTKIIDDRFRFPQVHLWGQGIFFTIPPAVSHFYYLSLTISPHCAKYIVLT